MKLSQQERTILANQYTILETLARQAKNDRDVKFWQSKWEIVTSGYEALYGDLVPGVEETTTSAEECRFVTDVLQMYRGIQISYDALDEKDRAGIDPSDLAFGGFDGNNETSLYGYAQFFCEDYEPSPRFKELTEVEGFAFNSHMPRSAQYRAMLAKWQEASGRQSRFGPAKMTRDQLISVLAAE